MDKVRGIEIYNLIQKGRYQEATEILKKRYGVDMNADELKYAGTKKGRGILKTITGKIFVVED